MANEREPDWSFALMLFAALLGVFVEAHALDLLKEAYRVESSVHLSNLNPNVNRPDFFLTTPVAISDGGAHYYVCSIAPEPKRKTR